ncbi:MAG: hypothetical protein IT373_24195 [Polyangiaceae bacterium]|nr:hypothetical protein [Polyangiaceae bacterium]
MSRRAVVPSLASLGLFAFALVPAQASAATGAEACGHIELLAVGECHFEFDGGCVAQCEPLSFVAECSGQCQASIDATCSASCSGSCQASCQADPGSFDCRASCEASCQADAHAQCGGDSSCEAYAQASCNSECSASCEVVPPSASCEAQCDAACSASCEVDANLGCELECTASLEGGCQIDCEAPTGALFCDGQYVAASDLPACIDYLISNFEVSFEASGEAHGSFSCNLSGGAPEGGLAVAATAGLLGLGLTWRRRRRPAR